MNFDVVHLSKQWCGDTAAEENCFFSGHFRQSMIVLFVAATAAAAARIPTKVVVTDQVFIVEE